MLHSRRKQQAMLAAREAAGESLWTQKFDEQARTRIAARLHGLSRLCQFNGGESIL